MQMKYFGSFSILNQTYYLNPNKVGITLSFSFPRGNKLCKTLSIRYRGSYMLSFFLTFINVTNNYEITS